MTLSEAVATGRLDGLRALRTALASEIESGGGEGTSQTAALARQLREVLKEIAELERANPQKSVVDDLGKRRAARRAGTAGAVAAGGNRRKQRT